MSFKDELVDNKETSIFMVKQFVGIVIFLYLYTINIRPGVAHVESTV
jgi:hypothetical protein